MGELLSHRKSCPNHCNNDQSLQTYLQGIAHDGSLMASTWGRCTCKGIIISFDKGAATTVCDCWPTSNGGNGSAGRYILFSCFVTTRPSVAVDDATGGVGSGVKCAATWRLFSPSASVRDAAELPEAVPSSCTMLKTLNCWISQQSGFTQLDQQMATRPHARYPNDARTRLEIHQIDADTFASSS